MKITIVNNENEGEQTQKTSDHLASLKKQTLDLQRQVKAKDEQLSKMRVIFLEMAQIANFMSGEQEEIQAKIY